jgi:Secretion system C-terminal sorting domain
MKHIYPIFFNCLIAGLLLLYFQPANAQCPYGFAPGTTAYDTTIATPPGINTLFVKFPQADPLAGMVTCLQLCVSITGVVDFISVENNSASPQTADMFYIRTDQITGPGLSGPLTNSINHHYGPYALAGTDGTLGSGPDYISITNDTLLNAVTVCQTINNLDSLFQFYGHDSVTYLYDITALTSVSCTGGNYNSTVATSALVRFHFEYCTCPGYVLPLNIQNFTVATIAPDKAKLTWSGFDDPANTAPYHYVTEISRDGSHFSTLGQVPENNLTDAPYNYIYTNLQQTGGIFYFRIKQVYATGYTRFSEIKQVRMEGAVSPKFKIYPNPSNGIVGIKFDNTQGRKMLLQIYNTQGQRVLQREIEVAGSYYQQVAALESGSYWLRLTDASNQLSRVNQLIIK